MAHQFMIPLISIISVVQGQSCTSYFAKAIKFTTVSEEACIAVSNYELCISNLPEGPDKTQHEAELQTLQSTFQSCVDVLTYTPRISTREDKMHLEAGDFIFARTKRDSVNLYTLRDTVVGYQSTLDDVTSTLNAKVDNTTKNLNHQMAVLTANLTGRMDQLANALLLMHEDQSDCIPYVEWKMPSGKCKLLSKCRPGFQYASVQPTRTSDRVCTNATMCRSDEYISERGDQDFDNMCSKLTKCPSNKLTIPGKDRFSDVTCRDFTTCLRREYESKPPTTSSDRECTEAPVSCPRDKNGVTYLLKEGSAVKSYCFNGRETQGDPLGDGTTKEKAGVSCYTIRHAHGKTTDGTYWVTGTSRNNPFQVFCDMTSCGGDNTFNWGNRSLCGGWTMVMSVKSGSSCLNRQRNSQWRTNQTFGPSTTRRNDCSKSQSYFRHSFTDVMIASHRNSRSNHNVAWRHPSAMNHMAGVVQSCTWVDNGRLLVPGYGFPDDTQRRTAIRNMDWRSCKGCTTSGHNFHDLCYRDSSVYKWGFFNRDSSSGGGQNTIVQCRSPWGHSGNVVGFGSGCGTNQLDCNRNYGPEDGRYTRCVSAWGFGSGYGGTGTGGQNSESVTGHFWGHGDGHMQQYETGLYIRNHEEVL